MTKAVLIYGAPGVSVIATAAWIFLAAYVVQLRKQWVVDRVLKRVRALRDAACADPRSTQKHKDALSAKVEHFEKLAITLAENEVSDFDIKVET